MTALARRLLAAGIPVIAVGPNDRPRQSGWQHLTAEQCDLSLYRPGDALAMVGGHGLDAVDVDPKNGGSVDNLPAFKSYGHTTTPSGGAHYIVPSCGLGPVRVKGVGDYIGARSLLFLPGSRRTKYPDGGYAEKEPWRIEECLGANPEPELVAALEKAGGSREQGGEHYVDDSPERDPKLGPHPEAVKLAERELARMDECSLLGWDGPPWDQTTYNVACTLVELTNSNWSGYDEDDLKAQFLDRAPTDPNFGPRQHEDKWASALTRVGNGGLPPRTSPEEEFEPWVEPVDTSLFDKDVEREARLLRIREAARTQAEREKRAHVERPALVRLDAFLEEPDDPTAYRVDGLWPAGGRVVLAAQNKSGKTTLTGNLIRSLVDGDRFLDQFEVERVGRIVLLDNELSPNMVRRWLRDQAIVNTAAVEVVPMRGHASTFNLLDPVIRSEWAQVIGPADVLIFDCLRPALDALGLSEDKESGRFLEALDELIAEAGIRELLVVHHMGHSNERSRGDSRLEDWPDAKWKLVREDPDDPVSDRYFSAFGRDVDQAEIRLGFNPVDRHLVVNGGSRRQHKSNHTQQKVLDYVADNPGEGTNAVETGVGGDRMAVRRALIQLIDLGEIRVEKQGQKHCHYRTLSDIGEES